MRGGCGAIETVERALATAPGPVYVRKQIVHNTHVIADLKSRGVIFVEEFGDIPDPPPAGAVTTLAADETDGIIQALRARFPHLTGPTADDICYATTNRQFAVMRVASQADVVLVVGSANSSNSVRLAEFVRRAGTRAYLIDDPDGIDPAWLHGARADRRGLPAAQPSR